MQKKREEQSEASRQRLFDSKGESIIESNETNKAQTKIGLTPTGKNELENSMIFKKVNRSWYDRSGDDSFLALERQCNMDDKKEQLINANDTLLFDIEPPTELWNQTVSQSVIAENLYDSDFKYDYEEERQEDGDETVEISPVKYIGLIRPSTIIEETSSQLNSYNKNGSSSTKSSLYETASIDESAISKSDKWIDDLLAGSEAFKSTVDVSTKNNTEIESESSTAKESTNQPIAIALPFEKQSSEQINADRQRRGTFAFKRANYTFFSNENMEPINESEAETQKNLIDLEPNDDDDSIENEDQFNNTLERVDYMLEKGKQILEETPIAKGNRHHQSLMETPLFSCKRKRLLNEMASIEMLPLAKRGPLIDFSTPQLLNKMFFNKFSDK